MQKSQLLQLQADLTRKKCLNDFLIHQLKSSTMSLNEKQAIKKAVDTFAVSISQMERSINIELKRSVLMIRWTYTKYGTILIDQIDNEEVYTGKSVYIQTEEDITSFLEYIGMTVDKLNIGDGDICKDIGYFED